MSFARWLAAAAGLHFCEIVGSVTLCCGSAFVNTKQRRGLCVCFMMRLVASFGRLQNERQDGHRLFLFSTALFDMIDVVRLILVVLLVDLKAAI